MSHHHTDASRRHDFVLLFDVKDGNPNGDPDNDNLPRTDPETGHGLVTDVCLKRKVRDYVTLAKENKAPYRIYVQKSDLALNTKHQEAYDALGIKSTGTKQKREDASKAQEWMCKTFYDIRTFGAVMSTEVNCGQVRGPLQLTFARSIDRVFSHDISITRVAVTDPKQMEVVVAEGERAKGKQTEMGRKALLPYGLYEGHGFFNPLLAQSTGFSNDDLALFWEALTNMFELDRSASRGFMALRGLYVFTHESKFGNAPAHKLFELIKVVRKDGVAEPRSFEDYEVTVPPSTGTLPQNVDLQSLVN